MSVLRTIAAAASLVLTVQSAGWAQSLIRDTEIEHVMRGYADPILEAAGLEPNDVDFYLVADPEINAFGNVQFKGLDGPRRQSDAA